MAVPLTPPAAAAGHPRGSAREVQLGSKIWKEASGFDCVACQSSQRQPVAHPEIKSRASFQFQLQFTTPASTNEPPSDKEGGLITTCATYRRKRGSVSPPRCPDFTASAFTTFTLPQSLAHRRCHLPYRHFPHRHTLWKSNSPQLPGSKLPFFIPLCYQLYARRPPCLTPC